MEASQRTALIKDLVLDSVADDFESFELVCDSVREWDSKEKKLGPHVSEIKDALLSLVEEGFICGYILTNTIQPLGCSEVLASDIEDLYFYLSEKGVASRGNQA